MFDALYRSIHHFYSNGNICDITGRHRVVEVRMSLVNFALIFRICLVTTGLVPSSIHPQPVSYRSGESEFHMAVGNVYCNERLVREFELSDVFVHDTCVLILLLITISDVHGVFL